MIRAGWIPPGEFWRLHPDEFWWLYEAKMPPAETDKWDRLYALLEN